jgi:hypothetical protein
MKINNLLMGIALLSTTAACTSELDAPTPNGDGEEVVVTYSVTIPEGIKTRAFSDGTKACNLHYAVYEVGTAEESKASGASEAADAPLKLKLTENVTITKGETLDVDLNLIQGRQYEIAFWAQSDNAPFTYKDATQTITYDYANAVANSDDADAFYAYEKIDVKCTVRESIVLTRPFAQINFGTDDIEKAQTMGTRVNRTTFSANAYTKLNLRTGKASEEQTITFRPADLPEGETFPKPNYDYLAMGYILIPNEKSLVDITLDVDNGKYVQQFKNIPVQRNFRSNIYGSLITNPAKYGLSVNSEYSGDDYIPYTTWDGSSIEKVEPDENNEIQISSAAELAYLSLAVNSGETYENNEGQVTITLLNDLDMNHADWRPIAANYETDYDNKGFCGVLDGNGHTISHLHVNLAANGTDNFGGLFGNMSGATIKNLTIDHATITNNNPISGKEYTGVLAGSVGFNTINGEQVPTTIENVTIKGLVVINANYGYVGTLIGQGYYGCKLSNITIDVDEGSYINAVNCTYVGGVGGYMWDGPQNKVSSNINIIASNPNKVCTSVGGLFGSVKTNTSYNGHILNNCSCSGSIELNNYDNTASRQFTWGHYYDDYDNLQDIKVNSYNMTIGGLVGSLETSATFNNCEFTGTITSYYVDSEGTKYDVTARIKNQYNPEDFDIYDDDEDDIDHTKLYNPNWKYIGWKRGGMTYPTSGITITPTPNEQ